MKTKDADIIAMMRDQQTREKGFRMMMDTYQHPLYWHIRRLVVLHAVAQDLLQDTFIKVYQCFYQFKQQSRLYTWLYRIATNEALQYLNKVNKMKMLNDEAEYYMQNLVAEEAENDAEEIQVLLQKAIQTLPEKQRLVFMMRYYDELPYEEISRILNQSVGTLKTNYHYAKQKVESYIVTYFEK